jgi:hypothetical protein
MKALQRGVLRGAGPLSLMTALLCSSGCTGNANSGGGCVVSSPTAQCADAGLIDYACNGSARPDEEQSESIDGIPQGIICTAEGVQNDGSQGFCCSSNTTPCVYDPVAGCAAPTYGYECIGGYDRPEAFDPTLLCGEGLALADNLITYCCSGQAPSHGCQQATSATCPQTLVPWTCTDQSLPIEAELGSNQSRADFNFLVCDVPTVVKSATGTNTNYCCFTPTSLPPGASCLFDTGVPGCAPGSFGFACTGPDTPGEDYAAVTCADAGTSGINAQGYPATLYCCQYQ